MQHRALPTRAVFPSRGLCYIVYCKRHTTFTKELIQVAINGVVHDREDEDSGKCTPGSMLGPLHFHLHTHADRLGLCSRMHAGRHAAWTVSAIHSACVDGVGQLWDALGGAFSAKFTPYALQRVLSLYFSIVNDRHHPGMHACVHPATQAQTST